MYFALITYIHLRRFTKTYSNSFYGTKMKQKKTPLISWSSAGLLTPVGSDIQTLLRYF